MHSKVAYEYAVIRLIPRVEREEFMNIGLLLMSKQRKYIRAAYETDCQRVKAFAPHLDIAVISEQLPAFVCIAEGRPNSGIIGALPIHERFRWLTANRSTIIQTSAVHGGITGDLDAAFERLYKEYVSVYTE